MTQPAFTRVLVANRGEIALRVMRTLRRMGIESVAVHSEADAQSPHVQFADAAVEIGLAPVAESYLQIDRIVEAARRTGCEAVHPGYGLLAENPRLVEACEDAGLVFIGPPVSAMHAMASKVEARRVMSAAGVPVVPGGVDPVEDVDQAATVAAEIGYPIAVKASGAGGGKGFRVAGWRRSWPTRSTVPAVRGFASSTTAPSISSATCRTPGTWRSRSWPMRMATSSISSSGTARCNAGTRSSSRSSAPHVSEALRERIGALAIAAAREVGCYRSAGTVEGLLVGEEFFFLEMNTRIQVEHCVTEAVTGIDIVEQQVLIAAGQPLAFGQEQVQMTGHAIECRINAENAVKGFLPSPGRITEYAEPAGEHIRVDSGVRAGMDVLPYYDPLLAKLIVWGEDRQQATRRMLVALEEFRIEGVKTLVPFHRALLASEQWQRGETCRDLVEDRRWLAGLTG